MQHVIESVLQRHQSRPLDLRDQTVRERLAEEISLVLKDSEEDQWLCGLCGESTEEVDYDYIGSGTNHLQCELKADPDDLPDIGEPDYPTGMTGHDHGKVWVEQPYELGGPYEKEVDRLSEQVSYAKQIIDSNNRWIYESPDGGKTVFRRPFGEYTPEEKEEIDWETKQPTGRKFSEYPWSS